MYKTWSLFLKDPKFISLPKSAEYVIWFQVSPVSLGHLNSHGTQEGNTNKISTFELSTYVLSFKSLLFKKEKHLSSNIYSDF